MTFLVDLKGNLRKSKSNDKFDEKIVLTQQPNLILGITNLRYLLVIRLLF